MVQGRANKKRETTIGRYITELRLAKGWTQATLSERSGLSAVTINRIERGWTRHPLDENLIKIFNALNEER